jgi:hypothetical protein
MTRRQSSFQLVIVSKCVWINLQEQTIGEIKIQFDLLAPIWLSYEMQAKLGQFQSPIVSRLQFAAIVITLHFFNRPQVYLRFCSQNKHPPTRSSIHERLFARD